jgi:ABC-type multidrug transport system fused ATPase/permease subunit
LNLEMYRFNITKTVRKKVLDNISFTILPGEVVGIIGPTGCGKTTLVQMIPRLYDVDAGEVLVDGIKRERLLLAAFKRCCWDGSAKKRAVFRHYYRKFKVGQ